MAKKFVQDVLPPERRTIRDIPISGTKPRKNTADPRPVKPTPVKAPKKPSRTRKSAKNYTRFGIWMIALVCVLGLVYTTSFLFASATVTVKPKSQNVSIDTTISAEKESSDKSPSYTLISVSKEGSKTVPAKGEEKVDTKATGKIIIYNNYSAAPQTLVKTTRFQTPDGLIFRITANITVPGYTNTNGIILPGFVKATVVADAAGEKYNVGLADFTIPGFKGDPKFTKFNAKTDPAFKIEGGFSGIVKKVSDADKLSAKNEIEATLRNELLALAKQQIPDTHIIYDDMALYSFEQLPQENSGSGATTATITEKGTIQGVIFDKKELTKFLTNKVIAYNGDSPQVSATNLDQLSVVFSNKATFNPASLGPVLAGIKGPLTVVWDIGAKNTDNKGLAEELAGKKRSQIKDILSKFSSIEKATVRILPPWSLSFPKNPNKITIKIDSQ